MRLWSRAVRILFLCVLSSATFGVQDANARPWKPTPEALAQDYALIEANKPDNSFAIVFWIVPNMIDDKALQAVLDKYVVIGIVQSHTDSTTGASTYDSVDTLQPIDGAGKPLKLLAGDNLPPAVAGAIADVQSAFRQSLGAVGQGFHWFVFEGDSVHACGKGSLSVPFGGETYTYDTPVPGCPKS
jgi:hypothetical protein